MLYLTIFRNGKGNRQKRITLEFKTIQEAVAVGQQSGHDYEIFDPVNGRNIDWNEINIREEEEWYYDENEMNWKKNTLVMENLDRIYSIIMPARKLSQVRVA